MPLCSVWVERHSTRKGAVLYAGVGGFQQGALIKDAGQFQLVGQNQPSFLRRLHTISLRKHWLPCRQAAHGFLLTDFGVACTCSTDLREGDGPQMPDYGKATAERELPCSAPLPFFSYLVAKCT